MPITNIREKASVKLQTLLKKFNIGSKEKMNCPRDNSKCQTRLLLKEQEENFCWFSLNVMYNDM